jgi:hypothetical protein
LLTAEDCVREFSAVKPEGTHLIHEFRWIPNSVDDSTRAQYSACENQGSALIRDLPEFYDQNAQKNWA